MTSINYKQDVYFCTCGCEQIVMSYFPDDPEDHEIGLTMWENRGVGRADWGYRLKAIWHIIKRGYPYSDDIILSKEDAIKLGKALIEFAEK